MRGGERKNNLPFFSHILTQDHQPLCAKADPQWDCQWPLGFFCVLQVRAGSTVCHLSFGQHRASQGVWLLLRDGRGLKNKTSNKRGVTVRSDLKWGEHNLLLMFH